MHYTTSLLRRIALGAMHVAAMPRLTRKLLFEVFLPGLLFEAAHRLEVRELRENWRTISSISVPVRQPRIPVVLGGLRVAVMWTDRIKKSWCWP